MNRTAAIRYASSGGAVALATALVLVPLVRLGDSSLLWTGLGWGIAATLGVAGGSWAIAAHGSPGPGCLLAMTSTIFLRLTLVPAGAFAAALEGNAAVLAFLSGALAGYLPLQFVEVYWLVRNSPESNHRLTAG